MSQSFKYSLMVSGSFAMGIPLRVACSELFVFWSFLYFINNSSRFVSSLSSAGSYVSYIFTSHTLVYVLNFYILIIPYIVLVALWLCSSEIWIWFKLVQFWLLFLFSSLFKAKCRGQQRFWCSAFSLAFSFLVVSVPALESHASLSFINHLFLFVLH